jgi:hypothetical protein
LCDDKITGLFAKNLIYHNFSGRQSVPTEFVCWCVNRQSAVRSAVWEAYLRTKGLSFFLSASYNVTIYDTPPKIKYFKMQIVQMGRRITKGNKVEDKLNSGHLPEIIRIMSKHLQISHITR